MREVVLALLDKYLPTQYRAGANGNVMAKCPFHKEGQETKPSFGVDVERGIFNCFTCKVAGPIGYLLRLLGVPRETIDLELKIIGPQLDELKRLRDFEKANFFVNNDPFKSEFILPEALLGAYEWCPTSLVEAGFDAKLLQDYEIGFDRINQRVTYPIRDLYGNLAGISGGRTLEAQEPKYKVYKPGYKAQDGKWVTGDFGPWFDEEYPNYKAKNHNFLWNAHRVYPRVSHAMSEADGTIFVVEGFKACLWMIQAGYVNTVALMGSTMSEVQQRILHRLGGPVVLCLDNDEAGRRGTLKAGEWLFKPMYGRVVVMSYPEEDLQDKTQPDDYTYEGLQHMMATALDFNSYRLHISRRFPWL